MIVMSLEDRSGRIRHDSSVSVATQVARDIEADITAGRLAPDTRLPSEPELSQQYGVARMTVRRAVAQLRDKGLVVTIHGRGSWVAPDDELDAPRTAPRRQPDVPLFDDSA
jgi:GntR family transcriptional regulator